MIDEKKFVEFMTTLEESNALSVDNIRKMIDEYFKEKWIPCSERLPEEVGIYIIHVITGNDEDYVGTWLYERGEHLGSNQTYIDDKQGYWANPYNGDPVNEFLSQRVVAWQPLPEPYREDK